MAIMTDEMDELRIKYEEIKLEGKRARAESEMKRANLMTGTSRTPTKEGKAKKVDVPTSMSFTPTVRVDLRYATRQFKELVATLDDPNCLLSPDEYKEIHEWMLRVSNASEDAKRRYKSRVETAPRHAISPKAKSTTAFVATASLDNSEYREYLDTLQLEMQLQLGDASLYE